MTTVTRENLAGLELAKKELGEFSIEAKAAADYCLGPLIAQASAAPEQEAAGHFSFCHDKKKWIQQKLKGPEFAHLLTPLYTHADPSEASRLRAELENMRGRVTSTHKSLIEKHAEIIKDRDDLRRQLAEAQALLREAQGSVKFHRGMGQRHAESVGDLHTRIDAFLSATAQPTECRCPKIGESWNPNKHGADCPVHAELREACKRFVAGNKPADGGVQS